MQGYEKDETDYDPAFVVTVPVAAPTPSADAGTPKAETCAAAAAGAGHNEQWERFVTKDGRPYFFQHDTGETTWTLPTYTNTSQDPAPKQQCVLL